MVVYSSAVARDNPEVAAARQRGSPGHPARGDARRADAAQVRRSPSPAPTARPPRPRWWPRSWPRRGSTPPWWWAARVQRPRLQRPARPGRVPGGGGRRVRRLASSSSRRPSPWSPTIDAEHLDHYADLDGDPERLPRLRATRSRSTARPCCASTTPTSSRSSRGSRSASSPTGSPPAPTSPRCVRPARRADARRFEVRPPRRRAWASCASRCPGATTCSTRWPPIAVGARSRDPVRPDPSPALAGFAGVQRRFQITGEAAGRRSWSTTTATIPPRSARRWPPPGGVRPARGRGVPAAPLHPDPPPVRRVPDGVLPVRRAAS